MPDPDDIAVANLRESLKKLDLYLQLGILASLAFSSVALSPSNVSPAQASLGFFSLPIQLTNSTFLTMFVGATIVFGILAAGALDHVYRALRHLAPNRTVLVAACGYPSLATSESRNARCAAIFASPTIITLTSLKAVWGTSFVAWLGLVVVALFVFIPFIVIWLALRVPLDDPGRYKLHEPHSTT